MRHSKNNYRHRRPPLNSKRMAVSLSLILVPVMIIAAVVAYTDFIEHIPLRSNAGTPGTGSLPSTLDGFGLVSKNPLTSNGKIVFLFIGSEACPYCAAESWAIVSALSNFGQWYGLEHIVSNSTDSIPDVPGYAFANATLESPRIALWEVELNTTSWSQKLQSPNATEGHFFNTYDSLHRIPFILIGGYFAAIGTPITPQLVSGKTWSEVSNNINSDQGIFAEQVISEAKNITGVIHEVLSAVSAVSINTHSTSQSIIAVGSKHAFSADHGTGQMTVSIRNELPVASRSSISACSVGFIRVCHFRRTFFKL